MGVQSSSGSTQSRLSWFDVSDNSSDRVWPDQTAAMIAHKCYSLDKKECNPYMAAGADVLTCGPGIQLRVHSLKGTLT